VQTEELVSNGGRVRNGHRNHAGAGLV